jgi:hypothetical protein
MVGWDIYSSSTCYLQISLQSPYKSFEQTESTPDNARCFWSHRNSNTLQLIIRKDTAAIHIGRCLHTQMTQATPWFGPLTDSRAIRQQKHDQDHQHLQPHSFKNKTAMKDPSACRSKIGSTYRRCHQKRGQNLATGQLCRFTHYVEMETPLFDFQIHELQDKARTREIRNLRRQSCNIQLLFHCRCKLKVMNWSSSM